MTYPCIVYVVDNFDITYADNIPFLCEKRYAITVIDKTPDSELPDKLLKLPFCSFNRAYTASNLNHWVFTLYY